MKRNGPRTSGHRAQKKKLPYLSVQQLPDYHTEFRSVLHVGHKRDLACSLDCDCQSSLMLCAVAGNSSGKDLASLRNILLQLRYILVIDLVVLFSTEHADFFPSVYRSASGSIALICKRHNKTSLRKKGISGCPASLLFKRQLLIDSVRNVDESVICCGRCRSALRHGSRAAVACPVGSA